MATIYLSDEVLAKLDKALLQYNKTHAATDRSAFLEYIIDESEASWQQ